MEKQSPGWVFPTVKVLVTLIYYFMLIFLVVYTLMSSVKLFNVQTQRLSSGTEPTGYVSIPVAWGLENTRTILSTDGPPIFLKPQKQTGQLQVPIRSMPGLVMVVLGLVSLVTGAWTFLLLRQIFRTVQTESPFHPDNARRINTMGLLFLGQTLTEILLKMVLWSQTRPYFRQIRLANNSYLSVDVDLDGPWLLGLILLALAQVYRRGIELQTENELTV
jgi:Protein of unknown function (DUF2975)